MILNPSFIKKIYLTFILGFRYEKRVEDAYKILNKNKSNLIDKIKLEIENTIINFNRNKFPIFHKYYKDNKEFNLSINQIIYHKYVNSMFSSKLAQCIVFNKIFFYPLPKEYAKIIQNNGIKINFFLSRLLFSVSIIFFFFKNFFSLIKYFFLNKTNIDSKKKIIYLDSLAYIDLINNKDNFFLWCKNFLKIDDKAIFIHDNKKILNVKNKEFDTIYTKRFYFNFASVFERIIYLLVLFNSFIKFIFYFCKGNLIHLLLIEEFQISSILGRFSYKIPKYALFNNSNCMIKPLWTKFLEDQPTKKVFMYFYSTNHFPLFSYNVGLDGYRLMSWHNYIFWIEDQARWLKTINQNFKSIDIVDYFPFAGKNISLSHTKKTISIFPVVPFKDKYISQYAPAVHYYNLNNSINFLNQILNCIKDKDIKIIVKLKRDHPFIHNEYKKFIEGLKKDGMINIIDPNVSATSIIIKSDLVISCPFTSTSLIANYFNIPTIFYDSSNSLPQEEPCLKKVQLIKSEKELFLWIRKVLGKNYV